MITYSETERITWKRLPGGVWVKDEIKVETDELPPCVRCEDVPRRHLKSPYCDACVKAVALERQRDYESRKRAALKRTCADCGGPADYRVERCKSCSGKRAWESRRAAA